MKKQKTSWVALGVLSVVVLGGLGFLMVGQGLYQPWLAQKSRGQEQVKSSPTSLSSAQKARNKRMREEGTPTDAQTLDRLGKTVMSKQPACESAQAARFIKEDKTGSVYTVECKNDRFYMVSFLKRQPQDPVVTSLE
jgi:uncharacterized protein HemX